MLVEVFVVAAVEKETKTHIEIELGTMTEIGIVFGAAGLDFPVLAWTRGTAEMTQQSHPTLELVAGSGSCHGVLDCWQHLESSGALEEERKKPVVLTRAASQPEVRRIEEAAAVATECAWEEAQRRSDRGDGS